MKRYRRALLVLLLLLLFVGLLAYSSVGVRFDISGKVHTEYDVLRSTLTHAVERAPDGSLVAPQAVQAKPDAPAKEAEPCPT